MKPRSRDLVAGRRPVLELQRVLKALPRLWLAQLQHRGVDIRVRPVDPRVHLGAHAAPFLEVQRLTQALQGEARLDLEKHGGSKTL